MPTSVKVSVSVDPDHLAALQAKLGTTSPTEVVRWAMVQAMDESDLPAIRAAAADRAERYVREALDAPDPAPVPEPSDPFAVEVVRVHRAGGTMEEVVGAWWELHPAKRGQALGAAVFALVQRGAATDVIGGLIEVTSRPRP